MLAPATKSSSQEWCGRVCGCTTELPTLKMIGMTQWFRDEVARAYATASAHAQFACVEAVSASATAQGARAEADSTMDQNTIPNATASRADATDTLDATNAPGHRATVTSHP
jgi:hypothetical protein